ncbi:MAG: hypothetical protein AAGG80_03685 [Pseudomonadota bacterium]
MKKLLLTTVMGLTLAMGASAATEHEASNTHHQYADMSNTATGQAAQGSDQQMMNQKNMMSNDQQNMQNPNMNKDQQMMQQKKMMNGDTQTLQQDNMMNKDQKKMMNDQTSGNTSTPKAGQGAGNTNTTAPNASDYN